MSNQNSENREGSNLPDFMSEKNKFSYVEDAETENSWLNNNLHRLMIWVSGIWLAVVLIYITQFFGWSNLFLMMPDEFGGFLAGVTLPLAIIWVVMAYIDRGSSFKREAKFLRAYMNQLVYPEAGSATTANAMAAAARGYLKGGTPEQCAAAAAMALGNLLGLVCDPVAGLVEVPCVKRNVVGAVNAVSCANMALAGVDYAIPCDEVIDAMGRVGSLLSPDLRETGQGGLAATPTGVRIAQALAEQG